MPYIDVEEYLGELVRYTLRPRLRSLVILIQDCGCLRGSLSGDGNSTAPCAETRKAQAVVVVFRIQIVIYSSSLCHRRKAPCTEITHCDDRRHLLPPSIPLASVLGCPLLEDSVHFRSPECRICGAA